MEVIHVAFVGLNRPRLVPGNANMLTKAHAEFPLCMFTSALGTPAGQGFAAGTGARFPGEGPRKVARNIPRLLLVNG